MINQRLVTAFKLAIKDYISGVKNRNEVIKPFRQQDIDYLLELIESAKTTESLYQSTKEYLSKIKTGFWIFKTGRSRLKKNFITIYNAKDYALVTLLLEDIENLRTCIVSLPPQAQRDYASDMLSLRDRIIELTSELEKTKIHCKTLEGENSVLKTLNDNFSYLNQELLQQLEQANANKKSSEHLAPYPPASLSI